MKVVRHNWMFLVDRHKCEDTTFWGDHRSLKEITCRGCGAEFPGWAMGSYAELDRRWHEEVRPMAELACMVEEANART